LYMFEDLPRMSALVVQVDIFMAQGELPQHMDEVQRRERDISLASKTLFNVNHIRDLIEMRGELKQLLAKLPASLRDDPSARKLASLSDFGDMTIARLINRGLSHAGNSRGYDFSRATLEELWATGLDDVRHSVAAIKSMQPKEFGSGVRLYELPPGIASSIPEFEDWPEEQEKEPWPSPRASRGVRPRRSRAVSTRHNGERSRRLARH
jgi:NTE family protein